MNLQSKFGYCIITQTLNTNVSHFVCKRDGIVDRQMDNGQTIRLLEAPKRTFQAGGIKTHNEVYMCCHSLKYSKNKFYPGFSLEFFILDLICLTLCPVSSCFTAQQSTKILSRKSAVFNVLKLFYWVNITPKQRCHNHRMCTCHEYLL